MSDGPFTHWTSTEFVAYGAPAIGLLGFLCLEWMLPKIHVTLEKLASRFEEEARRNRQAGMRPEDTEPMTPPSTETNTAETTDASHEGVIEAPLLNEDFDGEVTTPQAQLDEETDLSCSENETALPPSDGSGDAEQPKVLPRLPWECSEADKFELCFDDGLLRVSLRPSKMWEVSCFRGVTRVGEGHCTTLGLFSDLGEAIERAELEIPPTDLERVCAMPQFSCVKGARGPYSLVRRVISPDVRSMSQLNWSEYHRTNPCGYCEDEYSLCLPDGKNGTTMIPGDIIRVTQNVLGQWEIRWSNKGGETLLGHEWELKEAIRRADREVPAEAQILMNGQSSWRNKPVSDAQISYMWRLDHKGRRQFGDIATYTMAVRKQYPTCGIASDRINQLKGLAPQVNELGTVSTETFYGVLTTHTVRARMSDVLSHALAIEQAERGAVEILTSERQLVDKFLTIAHRKVSQRDEYDEENWEVLPSLIEDCIRRLLNHSQHTFPLELETSVKRSLHARLELTFKDFHAKAPYSHNTAQVESLDGRQFELYIRDRLTEAGFEVAMTSESNDQGADLIVSVGHRKHAIQVKRWRGKVSNSAVQEVVAARNHYYCDAAWVVTNSTFTQSARNLARSNGVTLIEGSELHLLPDKLRQMA